MDIMIKLTVPNSVYRFYQDASRHIEDSSPEKIMSDALCAYAGLLSKEVAKEQQLFRESQEPGSIGGTNSQ